MVSLIYRIILCKIMWNIPCGKNEIRHHKCRISPEREGKQERENLHWFPPRESMEHEFLPFLSQECTKVRRTLEISSSRSLWLWDSHQRQFLSLLFLLFPSWILWCPERVTYDAVLTVYKQKFIGYIIFVQKMSIVPLDLLVLVFFFVRPIFESVGFKIEIDTNISAHVIAIFIQK